MRISLASRRIFVESSCQVGRRSYSRGLELPLLYVSKARNFESAGAGDMMESVRNLNTVFILNEGKLSTASESVVTDIDLSRNRCNGSISFISPTSTDATFDRIFRVFLSQLERKNVVVSFALSAPAISFIPPVINPADI